MYMKWFIHYVLQENSSSIVLVSFFNSKVVFGNVWHLVSLTQELE